jgi:hypothetical protein
MRNAQQLQERSNKANNMRSSANLMYLLLCAHSACFTVFTRHSFGVAALGLSGSAAFGLMMVYICCTGSQAMALYFFVWFVAFALQQLANFVRARRGLYEHSRYEGYPWLGFLVPFVKRVEGAKLIEMLLCLMVGTLLLGVDQSLGQFVFFGFFSLIGKAAIEGQIEQNRVQQMRDAQIEMRQFADQFNNINF